MKYTLILILTSIFYVPHSEAFNFVKGKKCSWTCMSPRIPGESDSEGALASATGCLAAAADDCGGASNVGRVTLGGVNVQPVKSAPAVK